MTASELIELLKTFNPDHVVVVEVDHGDVRDVYYRNVTSEKINAYGTIACEEEEGGKDVVVIKA